MDERVVTTAELLEAWRDATRAADLAQRLAQLATETADQIEKDATISEDLAAMAERTAEAAEAAAKSARTAAIELAERARRSRESRVPDAARTLSEAREVEMDARDQYHRAAEHAGQQHGLKDSATGPR